MPEIFTVWSDDIVERIDPFYYRPEFKSIAEELKKIKAVPFGEVIKSIINGLDYRNFEDDGITDYLRVGNIRPYEIDFTDAKKINLDIKEISKDIHLKQGDVLLTRKGTFGVAVAISEELNVVISSEIFLIRLNRQDVEPKYIEAFLNSSVCQRQFMSQKVGAIMGSLSQEAVKRVLIPIPTLAIQKKIINIVHKAYEEKRKKEEEIKEILDSIDGYVLNELGVNIDKTRQDKTRQVSFTVWNDEIVNRFDPLYLRNIAMLKAMKSRYRTNRLADLIKEPPQYGANVRAVDGVPGKDIRYIRITDIDSLGNLRKDGWKTAETVNDRYLLKENDLLFARSGATAGKSFIYKSEFGKAIFAGYMIRFKIDEKKASADYIFSFTQTRWYDLWVRTIQRPAGQPNINSQEYKSLEIPLPSLSVQTQISDEVKARRQKVIRLKQEVDELLLEAKQKIEEMILRN